MSEEQTSEPSAGQEPAAEAAPPAQEPQPANSGPAKKPASRRRPKTAGQEPARVADYFTGCPRCSFFLAGYQLICQDFDEAAASVVDDWLDLSWNLAVRNLVAKSYGYEMSEPFEAFQGLCLECRRAFVIETESADVEEDRFSIQINPRS